MKKILKFTIVMAFLGSIIFKDKELWLREIDDTPCELHYKQNNLNKFNTGLIIVLFIHNIH